MKKQHKKDLKYFSKFANKIDLIAQIKRFENQTKKEKQNNKKNRKHRKDFDIFEFKFEQKKFKSNKRKKNKNNKKIIKANLFATLTIQIIYQSLQSSKTSILSHDCFVELLRSMSTSKLKRVALSVINVSISNIVQRNVSIKRKRRYFIKKFSISQKTN